MTEAEWLACEEPTLILEFLQGKASGRKLRLFAASCCRSVWSFLVDARSRQAVDAAERCADGELSEEEWKTLRRDAGAAFQAAITSACRDAHAPRTASCAGTRAALLALVPDALEAACKAADQSANTARRAPGADFLAAAVRHHHIQSRLLRDIFGNPFRPVTFLPDWRTSTAVALAAQMYDSRDFGAMPILADALQDAGCDSEDILNHYRETNAPHVRGCWVVDLVLGKE